jgi:L-asparaginase II
MRLPDTLAELTRADQRESIHAGSAVIATADGDILALVGDLAEPVFPRSAIKIIQALPLVETGAADHYDLSDAELALACASHSGAPVHVATAARMLAHARLDASALTCGSQLPLGTAEQHDLLRAGSTSTPLHHNCSGKHAAMLLTACRLAEPIEHYELAHHSVQQPIRTTLEEVVGVDLKGTIPAIDGCSVPNWPLPLDRLAIAYARIVAGQGLSPGRNAAFERLLAACWSEPIAMAGRGRCDTRILGRFAGDVFIKSGAEGVCCGGIRSKRIGFAVKVADGAKRAAETAVGAILARFLDEASDLGEAVSLYNTAGIAVGDVRPGAALMSVLASVRY